MSVSINTQHRTSSSGDPMSNISDAVSAQSILITHVLISPADRPEKGETRISAASACKLIHFASIILVGHRGQEAKYFCTCAFPSSSS